MPEYESVESFVEFLLAEDREEWTAEELAELSCQLERSKVKLVAELRDYGLRPASRESERRVRGFRTNNHDRWSAYMSHGGSGWRRARVG